MPDWVEDLLLESVAPPSNWLPGRGQRLADARVTLRRRFGQARETDVRPAHHLRDLGSAYPFGGSRVVSGDEIEAAMELEITAVNPPVPQGWMVAAGAVVLIVELFMAKRFVGDESIGETAAIAVGALILWLASIGCVSWVEHEIELDEGGVRVRRWTDRWLGRAGVRLGPPERISARLDDPVSLVLESPRSMAHVSLRLWPHSSRQDLVDELPIWGVDCSFGHHRHRPDRPGRRRRQQLRREARSGQAQPVGPRPDPPRG